MEVIRGYINQHNPAAAGRVVALIEKLAARLADFPESGPQAEDLDVRVIFSARFPYRIYYRVTVDEISILHIRHTARRPVKQSDL
jgi:plasmid stabilization system protein ParE